MYKKFVVMIIASENIIINHLLPKESFTFWLEIQNRQHLTLKEILIIKSLSNKVKKKNIHL